MTPVVSLTISPRTPEDAERLARVLERLAADDPGLRIVSLTGTSEVEIRCTSHPHLEQTIEHVCRSGINAGISSPRILYREALTRAADGESKYAKNVAGIGQYAHVRIQLCPLPPGSGCLVERNVFDGAIPDEFLSAVEQGIADGLEAGVLAGHPVADVRVEIVGGSYHDVDSSDSAFRTAGSLAVQHAARNAEPVLTEPVMRVEVVVPVKFEAAVATDLAARRGHVLPSERRGETQVIRALVPLANLFAFDLHLRHITLGGATCTIEFDTYARVQSRDDDDGALPAGVPRPAAPKPRDSAIALPEPDDSEPDPGTQD